MLEHIYCISRRHFGVRRFNSVRKFRLQSWTQSSPAHGIKWIRRSLLSALRELELRITAGKLRCCNDPLYCWVLNWIIPLPSGRRRKKREHHINQVNKTPVIQYRGKGAESPWGHPNFWYFTPFAFTFLFYGSTPGLYSFSLSTHLHTKCSQSNT